MINKKSHKRRTGRAATGAQTRGPPKSKPKLRRVALAAVKRIIRAARSAPGGEKLAKVDRGKLKWDLNFALATYRTAIEFGPDIAKRRDERWEAIAQTARELLRLLREDERDSRRIGPYYPHTLPGPRPIIHAVAIAARAAIRPRKEPEPTAWRRIADQQRRWLTARSPANFFAGEILYPLFREHFEAAGVAGTNAVSRPSTPAYKTTDGDTDSPFVRFADHVFREFRITHSGGAHYQRSFFASALTHARKQRARRKG
jgi:hypothetical protein